MEKPPFEKIAAPKLDEFLRRFFIDGLDYARIDNDPDAKDPKAADAWRMIVPEENARPFAFAWQHGLSTMERRQVSALYIKRVIPHRDGSPTVAPSLYGFTDGQRLVLFSADPARNRDDRFDLTAKTWEFATVREKVKLLHHDQLKFQKRLGRKTPQVEFLFTANHLSADDRFKRYAHTVREELMRAVISDRKALAAVLYHLLETPEDRASLKPRFVTADKRLKKDLEALHLEIGMRLGDAVAAAVDTLLLRYIMIRFIEAYHPEAMDGLLKNEEVLRRGRAQRKVTSATPQASLLAAASGAVTSTFTDTELELTALVGKSLGIDVSKAKRKAKGGDAMLFDLWGFDDQKAGAEAVLDEEQKREQKLGGDFYLADLGRAAREVEEAFLRHPSSRGGKLLQDFLRRTSDPASAKWEFRYEDLRPQTLQDYYESSLSTAVQLRWNKQADNFQITVGKSQRQRKELGAYYTDARLCRFMVERTVKPLFEQRLTTLQRAIGSKDLDAARQSFESIVTLSICDPTMGSAPFLRSAFDYLSEQYLPLCRTLGEAAESLPKFYDEVSKQYPFCGARGGTMDEDGVGRWEWHILRRMLHGVDIDLKGVCIACQTFALSALKYLRQGERFPSFFNLNLKLGNALISPVKPAERAKLAKDHGKEIAKLIKLRREAMTLANNAEAYEKLATVLRRIDEIEIPIARALIEESVAPTLEEFTAELRPFCWELEFPEIFFTDEGELKAEAGFDVVIGNPPWEEAYIKDSEFLSSHGFDPKGEVEKITKQHPELKPIYDHYLAAINKWQEWAGSDAYQYQQGGRHRNYWRMAIETALNLLQPTGYVSLVVPSGIISDEGPAVLRERIFADGEADRFVTYEKQNEVFTASQAFTVFSLACGKKTKKVAHIDGLVKADDLQTLPDPVWLGIELIHRMSPDYLTIPPVRDQLDARILEKFYAHPLITASSDSFHAIPWSGDYNLTLDRGKFIGGSFAVLEGKHIEQYNSVEPSEVRHKVRVPRLRGGADPTQYRITWRDIAGTLDARRMYATMLPKQCVSSDLLNILVVQGNDEDKLFLLGVINSLVFEWRVRQIARSNHIKPMIMRQMSCPRPLGDDADRKLIINRAARLLIVDKRLSELTEYAKGGPISNSTERYFAICEIDAAVARLFRWNKEELDRILSRYDKVEEQTKATVRKLFTDPSSTWIARQ